MRVTASPPWISPLFKQCFVTLGVALNMLQLGLVMGLPTTLVPQLREPTSHIPVNDNSGSWVAAIPGFTFFLGNLITPSIMGRYGRKVANLSSLVLLATSWICIIFASGIVTLMIARSLQGIGIGMTALISPALLGEYTSPRNRGAFLMTLSVAISVGVLVIHTLGLYMQWYTIAIMCVGITAVDLIIVAFSPESPSWLATMGRYDDCRNIFHWLRGETEEEELEKLINSSIAVRKTLELTENNQQSIRMRLKNNIEYLRQTFLKPEFYKPIIIMVHIYTMAHWSGVNIFASYAVDLIHMVAEGANVPLMIISFDVQRAISNALALIIVKHMKRRTLLLLGTSLNVTAMIVISAYVYAKSHSLLPCDSIYIGLTLAHIHMFSIAIGALPISFIVAGEIFPLEYKALASGISSVTFSINIFTAVKTAPYLFNSIGLDGAYLLFSGIVIYCLVVTCLMMPETKDRTLLDIEEEFRGKKKSTQALQKL